MTLFRPAAIALFAVTLLVVACGDHRVTDLVVNEPSQAGISVSGHGSVVVVPDIAVLTLGVEVIAPTVAAARSKVAGAMKAVRSSLDANDIGGDDIKTLSFNIQPQYQHRRDEQREITGYTVSNRVSVKVRDLDTVSTVLDDATEAGGDAARINGISFAVDEPEQYESDARKAAVEDARKRAEELAALAGVKLGKVRSITESSASMPFAERGYGGVMLQSAAAPRTPISPGETEISLSVSIVYRIE
ncbi:MAG: SIMPL domain-containing protein [Deltaproteobacteria bacterium]|nr:SIMPL domain-containing protein [Deltaproteobacteria bacterium]